MNKEEKKMQEMDDDVLEGVSGGYSIYNKKSDTWDLYGDGRHEHQGTFKNKEDMEGIAKRLGTSTKSRGTRRWK